MLFSLRFLEFCALCLRHGFFFAKSKIGNRKSKIRWRRAALEASHTARRADLPTHAEPNPGAPRIWRWRMNCTDLVATLPNQTGRTCLQAGSMPEAIENIIRAIPKQELPIESQTMLRTACLRRIGRRSWPRNGGADATLLLRATGREP